MALDYKPVRGNDTGVGMSVVVCRGRRVEHVVAAGRRRRAERAVRVCKQHEGVCGTGASIIGGMGAHRCRVLCASHASSLLAWECHARPRRGQACCSCPSIPCVLASVMGSAGLAGLLDRGAIVAPLVVSRAPPEGGEGPRSSTWAWGSLTGAYIAPTTLISSNGKGGKHGALCEGQYTPRLSAPRMLMASIRELSRNKDQFTRATSSRAAGRRRRVDCVLGAGRAAVPLASALGGEHEEAASAVGVGAEAVGITTAKRRRRASKLVEMRVRPHSNIERRSGVKVCGVGG
eukprot:6188576-Pleurochrysis_carterae.AAC.3